jgi:hypothetical protein
VEAWIYDEKNESGHPAASVLIIQGASW